MYYDDEEDRKRADRELDLIYQKAAYEKGFSRGVWATAIFCFVMYLISKYF